MDISCQQTLDKTVFSSKKLEKLQKTNLSSTIKVSSQNYLFLKESSNYRKKREGKCTYRTYSAFTESFLPWAFWGEGQTEGQCSRRRWG